VIDVLRIKDQVTDLIKGIFQNPQSLRFFMDVTVTFNY